MPSQPVAEAALRKTLIAVAQHVADGGYVHDKQETGQKSAILSAANDLGISHSTVRLHLEAANRRYNLSPEDFLNTKRPTEDELQDLPDGKDVLDRHAPANTAYIKKARGGYTRIIPVRPEPFAIAFIGDIHADNKGTDLAALQRDLDLLRAAKIRAVNIGDTLDNFHHTSKLASKQAANRMSASEGLGLARWIIRDCGVKWDAHIIGNHDQWAGDAYAQLFQEWARPSRFYDWIVRLEYVWDGGSFNVLAAHDFKGNSVHNPLHGLFRRAQEDGTADLYVAGHRHNAAEGAFENGFRQKRYNFLRVGSYKKWDDYAHRKGFDQQGEGSSALAVINPWSDSLSGRCRLFPDLGDGLEYLRVIQQR